MEKQITVLGSTGSIGKQGLAVCENIGYGVATLAAGRNVRLLAEQARKFRPRRVVIADPGSYKELKQELSDLDVQIEAGAQAVCDAAAGPADMVLNAIVGIAGLRPALSAVRAGNRLALANKEALVTGGELVLREAERHGAAILPVDSEHSAIFQCLRAGQREDVRGIVLTASGGPFYGKTRAELRDVGVKQALAHPTWNMGAKITVDSATLINKGLEFFEAIQLFGLNPDQIDILIHRQSVLHSAVEFADGSLIGQMGIPDMRTAIQYAFTYPQRLATGGERLSLFQYGALTFERPDMNTFEGLAACMEAARKGGLAPCVVNGANEQAVQLFLDAKIGFLQIGELVSQAVATLSMDTEVTLDTIEAADRTAREFVLSRAL